MAPSKKEMIFTKYAGNLKLLADNKLIGWQGGKHPTYICPICLKEFGPLDEGENHLTLEHVPPETLGGKANILTCSKCNNEAGYKIDAHLVERLRQLDTEKLEPGTEIKITVKIGTELFRGKIIAGKNGQLQIEHSLLNNHPKKLTEAMKNLKENTTLDADFVRKKVIPENLEYALLKTGICCYSKNAVTH